MRKFCYLLLAVCYLLLLAYLLLPKPEIAPLPNSFKSTEPGDTVEIPGVSAYYTNMDRSEVMNFYKREFGGLTLRLNHPPEYAKEIIRDTIHSEFFEELVHPFRESLFVNGWTPREDEEYQRGVKKPLYEFERGGEKYQSKITLYFVPSNPLIRLVVFHLSLLAIFGLIYLLKSIVSSRWLAR